MKKNILIILGIVVVVLVVVLVAMNMNKTPKANVTCEELYKKISEKVSLPSEMIARTDSDLDMRYGIDTTKAEDYIFMANSTSYFVDTIAIFKVKNTEDRKTLESQLMAIKKQAMDSMNNYDAEQYKIATDGIVYVNGEYVVLIMTSDVNKVKTVINENI